MDVFGSVMCRDASVCNQASIALLRYPFAVEAASAAATADGVADVAAADAAGAVSAVVVSAIV